MDVCILWTQKVVKIICALVTKICQQCAKSHRLQKHWYGFISDNDKALIEKIKIYRARADIYRSYFNPDGNQKEEFENEDLYRVMFVGHDCWEKNCTKAWITTLGTCSVCTIPIKKGMCIKHNRTKKGVFGKLTWAHTECITFVEEDRMTPKKGKYVTFDDDETPTFKYLPLEEKTTNKENSVKTKNCIPGNF